MAPAKQLFLNDNDLFFMIVLTWKDGSSEHFSRVHLSSWAVMSGHDSSENAHANHKGAVGILPFFVANNKVGTELKDEASLHFSEEEANNLRFSKVSEYNGAEDFTCARGVLKCG